MVGINFLNYMDRYVGAAASPLIQKEFHLSDSQVGLLGSAFLLVYAVAAVPFGFWADRGVRKTVVAAGVAIWSLATLFTGFARSFPQLFVSRAVLGRREHIRHRGRICRRRIHRREVRLAERVLFRRRAGDRLRAARVRSS
jgi:hypothetical protein